MVEHGGCGSYGNSGSGRRSSIQEVVYVVMLIVVEVL